MKFFSSRLWRHHNFVKLWAGETVEWFGDQISSLALPTVAILILNAGPFEMGVLGTLNNIAFPVFGLLAGVMADRWRKRPVLVWTNIIQVIALGSIPAAFLLGQLYMWNLYAVAVVMSVTGVFFVAAYQAYLPTLVGRRDLMDGNAKLEVSSSASLILGPAIAGFLVQLVGAANSIAADALSTLTAALAILSINKPEAPPAKIKRNFSKELKEGLGVVFRSNVIRALTISGALFNFGRNMFFAIFFIFIYDTLQFSPGLAGLVIGIGSVGFLIGAIMTPKVVEKLGLGTSLIVSTVVTGVGLVAVPAASYGYAAVVLTAVWMFSNFGMPIYNINQVSLRQAVTVDRLQGRMNATVRTITWGAAAAGAFVGGVLGSIVGVPNAMIAGAALSLLPVITLFFSPIRSITKMPKHPSAK